MANYIITIEKNFSNSTENIAISTTNINKVTEEIKKHSELIVEQLNDLNFVSFSILKQ